MAFTWIPIIPKETVVSKIIMQEIIDAIGYMEDTQLKFGCTSNTLYPSGRTQGSDPVSKFSSWKSNMSPTFERVYIEATDITTIRSAIDPIYDNRNSCRVVYASDYQSNDVTKNSTVDATDKITVEATHNHTVDAADDSSFNGSNYSSVT